MEEKQVAPAGSFRWNEGCADYGQVGKGNSIKNGKTDKGVQRYRCQMCTKTFTQTKGTIFYRCRHFQETIVECLAMLGDRTSLAAIHRIKGSSSRPANCHQATAHAARDIIGLPYGQNRVYSHPTR